MKAPCTCALWGRPDSPPLAYEALSTVENLGFNGWLHCRNARSTVKLTKMIAFEVADSNLACGRGLCYRPVARTRTRGGRTGSKGRLLIQDSRANIGFCEGFQQV